MPKKRRKRTGFFGGIGRLFKGVGRTAGRIVSPVTDVLTGRGGQRVTGGAAVLETVGDLFQDRKRKKLPKSPPLVQSPQTGASFLTTITGMRGLGTIVVILSVLLVIGLVLVRRGA